MPSKIFKRLILGTVGISFELQQDVVKSGCVALLELSHEAIIISIFYCKLGNLFTLSLMMLSALLSHKKYTMARPRATV